MYIVYVYGARYFILTKTRCLPLGVSGVRRFRLTQFLSDVTGGGACEGIACLVTMAGTQTVPTTIGWTGEREGGRLSNKYVDRIFTNLRNSS